jgi:hypothetical protein
MIRCRKSTRNQPSKEGITDPRTMSVIHVGPPVTRSQTGTPVFPEYPGYFFADITRENIDEHHKDFPANPTESLVFSITSHLQSYPTAYPKTTWLTPPTRPGQKAFENNCKTWFSWPDSKDYCEKMLLGLFSGEKHLYLVYHYNAKDEREIDAFMFWYADFYANPLDDASLYTKDDIKRFADSYRRAADEQITMREDLDSVDRHELYVHIDLLGAPPRTSGPKNLGSFLMNRLFSVVAGSSAAEVVVELWSLAWRIATSSNECLAGNYFGLSEDVYEKLGFKKLNGHKHKMMKFIR